MLLGSRCVASSRWLRWICETGTRTSLDSNRFHGYFLMSTEQFDYVLRLVMGPHILHLPTVYVAVYVQGCTTTSYVQKWAEIEHVSISAFHDVPRRTTSRVLWMPPILCMCSIRTTTYDVVRSVNAALYHADIHRLRIQTHSPKLAFSYSIYSGPILL